MMTTLDAASAMPTTLSSACELVTSARTASTPTYGASRKNWTATSFCALCSALAERVREPVNRQTITTLAKPSIAESIPKPIRAMDPATMPAPTATAPSSVM